MLRRNSSRAQPPGPPLGGNPSFSHCRLFDPEQIEPVGGAELSARLTIRQFFQRWVVAEVLRKSRPPTIRKYFDAIAWWEAITGDPPLEEITDSLCRHFTEELPEAKYRRAAVRRGAQVHRSRESGSALYRTLAPISAAKHVNRIAFILGRAGPRFDPREPVAELLKRCPLVPRIEGDYSPKPPFELELARAIAAEALKFDKPDMPGWITPPQFWELQMAEYFYTGLRSGTVLSMAVKHFRSTAGTALAQIATEMLDVPGDIVFKTSKPIRVAVHPQLSRILRERTAGRDPDELLLPLACSYSHLLDLHEQIQRRAGLTDSQIQSLHGWRRTHGNQMALLGAADGIKIAQAALDHADERTTQKSYVNAAFLNRLRLKLPELWPRRLFE